MAPIKSTLTTDATSAGPQPVVPRKTALPQNDRPAKPVRRSLAKVLRPRLVEDVPPAAAPAVILWDDPVEPAPPAKPRR